MDIQKKLLFLIAVVFSINSQELDQSFLESIPEDIRNDLIEKNSKNTKNTKENYRPYIYSSKLNQAEELIELKERLELDLLELERRLDSKDSLIIDKDLKLFGSSFFNTFQTTFMPINEPNPDSGYILDVGDALNIQLVGQKDDIYDALVNRQGSINLKDVGQVRIAGLTLNEASNIIKSKVAGTYIGTNAFITLSSIRDVNVLVTGNSKNPGIYTLSGNSNILHAISASGGINEYGSYREINLIRDDIVIESLDVYDLLINGRYNLKKRLRSGDVIFVESRKNIVTIDGAVNRPAKYEVKDEQNLNSIINYANGLKRTADVQNISLERLLDGSLKTIPIVNKSQFEKITALDGDLIYIREFPYREAKISGAVLKPGKYTMALGETLQDLVQKAGGYSKNAYVFGAIYQNEEAKNINAQAKQKMYDEFLNNLLYLSQLNTSQDLNLTPVIKLTEEVKNSEPNGRVVVNLEDSSTIDLYPIKDKDELYIPEISNVVYVYGETSSEGAVVFSSGKGVDHYIEKSGGFKKFAAKKSIYILHPNGESQLYSIQRNIFESSPKSVIKIYPGSIIFVPKELDEATPRRLATQAYVSIVGNLALALASLSSINN